MGVRPEFIGSLFLFLCVSLSHGQQKQAYLNVNRTSGSAVDVNGFRHTTADYPGHHAPWLDDRTAAVAPKYPLQDLRLHHQGSGSFRLLLDLQTGCVGKVILIRSTGFSSLDQSAMAAVRKWQWKPGKWKEITVTTVFTMNESYPLGPGASKIPHQ